MDSNKMVYSYNFPWHSLKDEQYRCVIREYLDNGVNTFVFTDPMITSAIEKPERIDFFRKLVREMGVRFVSMHAPCGGETYDLNIPVAERRPGILKAHIRGLEIAAEFGCKTYTVHPGAHYRNKRYPMDKLHENTLEMLEKLMPHAEKNGVVIAVENSFEPPNNPNEVVSLIRPFASSPFIGACYDTGHANVMAATPGKEMDKYAQYVKNAWWEKGIIQEKDALGIMRDYVVTTHIHDNDGYGDLHGMPFDGTIDWASLMPRLESCPRMMEMQTELHFEDGEFWAGKALAPIGGYSIRRQVEVFSKLGFKN